MEAARESCPDESCIGKPFLIGDTYFMNYPMRCFVTDDGKWFFNPTGDEPTNLMGKGTQQSSPVCVEPEYHNATSGNCPTGSQTIMEEETCRTAATCLGKCSEAQFRVLNETTNAGNHHDAPVGCHINPADGCVRFNTIKGGAGANGQVLCNLTIARDGGASGGVVATASDAAGAAASGDAAAGAAAGDDHASTAADATEAAKADAGATADAAKADAGAKAAAE